MRFLIITGTIGLFLLAFSSAVVSGPNHLGIADVRQITFSTPVRIGTTLLPAGDYEVRHTMQGDEHIMVFTSRKGKGESVKAKCNLVSLPGKSGQTQTVYEVNSDHEKVLREMVFRGDTAKHV